MEGRQNAASLEFDPEPSETAFLAVFFFSNFHKCRPVAADNDMGCSTDVRAAFGESALNSGRIILLFGRPNPFCASLLSSI